MKRYTYPAVVYKSEDESRFAMVLNDLDIVASGETIEEAFENALMQLKFYLGTAIAFEHEIPNASEFADVSKAKPKNIVLLASERIDEKRKK